MAKHENDGDKIRALIRRRWKNLRRWPMPSPQAEFDLTEDERRLLASLACGDTVWEAAESAHMSLRTANRRLAKLRERADAPSTRDLVSMLKEQVRATSRPTL